MNNRILGITLVMALISLFSFLVVFNKYQKQTDTNTLQSSIIINATGTPRELLDTDQIVLNDEYIQDADVTSNGISYDVPNDETVQSEHDYYTQLLESEGWAITENIVHNKYYSVISATKESMKVDYSIVSHSRGIHVSINAREL